MSNVNSLSQSQVNCQQSDAPIFPDIFSLGTSRIGKKLTRKAVDAYYVAFRRYDGTLAKSGPPTPNSQKHGRREYLPYFETVKRGVHSGYVRNLRAQPRHNQARRLRAGGSTIKAIAELVGLLYASCPAHPQYPYS